MQQQQQQPYQQHEMQDMYYQHQVQQYPYQQLYQQPDQQPYPQHPYPNQQQLYQHQQQQQQQQQPIVPSQPAINWVYTDLPVQRLETLGTLQVVIGTILIVLIMLFVSQYNNIGYFWSVLVSHKMVYLLNG
jgi:hypothetical protein